jgi:hypothetical protein
LEWSDKEENRGGHRRGNEMKEGRKGL